MTLSKRTLYFTYLGCALLLLSPLPAQAGADNDSSSSEASRFTPVLIIQSLASLETMLHVNANSGSDPLGQSEYLVASSISSIHPRKVLSLITNASPATSSISSTPSDALSFSLLHQYAEITAFDPVAQQLNFYVAAFQKGCNLTNSCALADLLAPAGEINWINASSYKEDSQNAPVQPPAENQTIMNYLAALTGDLLPVTPNPLPSPLSLTGSAYTCSTNISEDNVTIQAVQQTDGTYSEILTDLSTPANDGTFPGGTLTSANGLLDYQVTVSPPPLVSSNPTFVIDLIVNSTTNIATLNIIQNQAGATPALILSQPGISCTSTSTPPVTTPSPWPSPWPSPAPVVTTVPPSPSPVPVITTAPSPSPTLSPIPTPTPTATDTPIPSPTPSPSPDPVVATATFTLVNSQILQPSCVACHGAVAPAAGISFATYAATSTSVVAGNPAASILYVQIEQGLMPQGAPPLPAAQLQLLSDWITSGAPNN
jgi:hypothetical protein